MKMIVAIIRPERLTGVQQALAGSDGEIVAISETHSFGSSSKHTLIYRSASISVRSSPRLRVEVLAEGFAAEEIFDILVDKMVTGEDGRVFVMPLDQYCDYAHHSPATAVCP